MQRVGHVLRPARRDQRDQPSADRDRDDVEVVAVTLVVDSREDADAGRSDHAEHHEARAAENELRYRFDECRHLGQQAERQHDRARRDADEAAAHAGDADEADIL